jgi:transposase
MWKKQRREKLKTAPFPPDWSRILLERSSFCVMVLCYSRRMYVEFTLAQTQQHFLACHQHAFEYFNSVPAEVIYGRQL